MLKWLRRMKHLLWAWRQPHLRVRDKYRRAGCVIPDSSRVEPTVWMRRGVTIGNGCYVNEGCRIEPDVTIGDRVLLGPGVFLLTISHDIGGPEQRCGADYRRPTKVGDGCWIGARAIVLPGVEIAPGCVVAAGAVVTESTSPNGLYAGVPARRVRDL